MPLDYRWEAFGNNYIYTSTIACRPWAEILLVCWFIPLTENMFVFPKLIFNTSTVRTSMIICDFDKRIKKICSSEYHYGKTQNRVYEMSTDPDPQNTFLALKNFIYIYFFFCWLFFKS